MITYEQLIDKALENKLSTTCIMILMHIWAMTISENKATGVIISIDKILRVYPKISPCTLCKRLRYLEEKRFIKTFQKLDISDYDLATEVRFL